MTRPFLLAVLTALCLWHSAGAVETPHAGHADPRIKTVDYDPQQVVRLVGAFRTATEIQFGDTESIRHVALGDTTGWDVVAERNILFAKPKAVRAPTNLIVTTAAADGAERHYTFELVTRAGPIGARAPDTFFVVRFHYPVQEKAQVLATLSAAEAALQRQVLQFKLERAVLEGPRNLAYELQGSSAIAPSEVTDNGVFTVLRFPGAEGVPAVYAVAPDGAETLAPFDVRGEFVVVHQTAAQLRLRRGREVLCIFNTAFRPYGSPPTTGTTAPDVQRTFKDTPKP
ncbi:TrbG/VirB9 family P-type conjugative transfer protein [Phenylobacterium sp.]|uniref:TrbG/VirB9 family P-type conjugative transfer protein n=1 Tax=Phenylobacterium sp. TaxID=1871053 RepID=UPI003561B6B8